MDTIDQLEAFFAGGVAAAKFPDGRYGHVIGGEITADPRMQQQRDYTTGDPITYQDGNPAMQMVVVVQTGERDPAADDDDGQRALYIKGQMKQAVGEALRKAGEKTLRRGGKLWIKYTEDKPVTLKNGRPGNPQKIYAAKYEPPAAADPGQFFNDTPAKRASPAMSADSMRSSSNATPALPCPPDFNPGTWSSMTPVQQEKMYDALGMVPPGPSPMSQAARFTDEPPF